MTMKTVNFKTILPIVYTAVVMGLVAKFAVIAYEKRMVHNVNRAATICPAYFSITRSSRDTLIVMKAEPLCNNYVLMNLK
jgi:hypothetical protein